MIFATFNIAHCSDYSNPKENGECRITPEKVAKVLKRTKAQVIGLNEVYDYGERKEFCSQTEKLSKLLGYESFVYATGKEFPWKDVIGNAQISKYRIKNVKTYPVLSPSEQERNPKETEWYEDRVIIKTVFETEQGDIAVINTHFGLNPQEQKNMINKLLLILQSETLPCVLMGDFNSEPDSKILRPLYEIMVSAGEYMGHKDDFTFSSYNPYVTLDYIFFSKHFDIKGYYIDKEIISDHLAIYAEADLKENK